MLSISKTTSFNPAFIKLNSLLDKELAIRDGDDHAFYAQYNTLTEIKHILLAYLDGEAVACGALKQFDSDRMEIKRMFVILEKRGHAYAGQVLKELESWAKSLGFSKCILETGVKQPEAIRLYEKMGYHRIENYGQYKNVATSYCFEKAL